MRTLPLVGIFAALLFIGVFGTSYATDELADHVVINEIDTNPVGDDSKTISEWIELYNPTDEDVNIGGWKIASTTVTKKTMTIPASTVIKPGQFLVYSYQSLWFTDVSEKVLLKDKEGNIIDETQVITDQKNDYQSWQRKYDGVVSESNVWIFKSSSPGSSNGKLAGTESDAVELVISTKSDKRNYVFSETAIISGNVSKRVYQEKPTFTQQQITINVDGPGTYQRDVTIYPDLNLQYKTLINLDKAQGATAGIYKVNVKYGEASDYAAFSVGDKAVMEEEQKTSELTISTDKSVYVPGQTVKISAVTDTVIPGEGLKYVVYNADKIQIFSGKLFPNKFGEFTGNVYMTLTKPVYGTLNIVADYGDQHAKASFDLAKDEKDTQKIILVTDKDAYAPGETIVISGRSNKHVVALDLEVIQTDSSSPGKSLNNIFKHKNQVKLAGDSTFRYELNIPAGKINYGDYRITISKEFGKATTAFKIVENPDDYVATAKYYIKTDEEKYVSGSTVQVSGHVDFKERSSFEIAPVQITLLDDKGKQIKFAALDKKLINVRTITSVLAFTAIPDASGNFNMDFNLNPISFTPGVYTLRATYDKRIFDTTFVVGDPLDIKNRTIIAKLDKEIYGLGETVKLDGTLVSGQSAVNIVLTKPDGKSIKSGAKIDNSKFTWSWTAPPKDYDLADIRDHRQARPSVFGTYKISIVATSENIDLFFKLSENPASDSLAVKPLEVKAEKPVYRPGEKLLISGIAVKKIGADATTGTVVDRVNVEIRTLSNKVIYTSNLDLGNGGTFKSAYDLPLTIFKDGKYKIVATYHKTRADATFEIKNDIPISTDDKITLTLSTDKKEYLLGDTVHITGATNKVLFLNPLDLVVNLKKTGVDCGKFYCGLGGNEVDISRTYLNGLYSYDYTIPANSALGTYEVKIDTDFGTFSTTFEVVDKLTKKATGTAKISEKFNRITSQVVDVGLFEQTKDETLFSPSTLQGSLVVPRGSEKTTNLAITADDGSCIIGQAEGCLVSGPTKENGIAYKVVSVAGLLYKVTYSGPEQILEKFSITPELDEDVIPDSIWVIQVDGHIPSAKLYYEIVYKQIQ